MEENEAFPRHMFGKAEYSFSFYVKDFDARSHSKFLDMPESFWSAFSFSPQLALIFTTNMFFVYIYIFIVFFLTRAMLSEIPFGKHDSGTQAKYPGSMG